MITITNIQLVRNPTNQKIVGIQFEISGCENHVSKKEDYFVPKAAFYCVDQRLWPGVRMGNFPSNYPANNFVFESIDRDPTVFHTIPAAIDNIVKLLEEVIQND